VERLARATPLAGRRVLDIGASPHGFALEWALRHRVAEYVGIGLDMPHEMQVRAGTSQASLRRMNAQDLQFPDGRFDAALSISTFEHIADLDLALSECHRVLRPRGQCLLVFEPIWTSSIGHHLHHFGPVASLVPDWAHLLWSREEMARHLEGSWPADAPITAAQALHWIYDGEDLNRKGIREIEAIVARSPLRVEHKEPLREALRQPAQLEAALAATGLAREELLTRGFSLLLVRP
jgi:SAM-dependent methyltransferase